MWWVVYILLIGVSFEVWLSSLSVLLRADVDIVVYIILIRIVWSLSLFWFSLWPYLWFILVVRIFIVGVILRWEFRDDSSVDGSLSFDWLLDIVSYLVSRGWDSVVVLMWLWEIGLGLLLRLVTELLVTVESPASVCWVVACVCFLSGYIALHIMHITLHCIWAGCRMDSGTLDGIDWCEIDGFSRWLMT